MNFEYIAGYDGQSPPKLVKRLSAESGEVLEVPLSYANSEEIDKISANVMYDHLRNLIQYIKDVSSTIYITERDDQQVESWPIKNWTKIEEAKNQAIEWWQIAYFRDEEEPSDV